MANTHTQQLEDSPQGPPGHMRATRFRAGRFLGHRRIRVLGSAVLTLALLAWAVRGISPTLVWSAVRGAEFQWLGAGIVAFLASFSVRARRWGTLLGVHRDPGRFAVRHAAVFIGFAGNCVLPAHAGEIARAAVLRRFSGISFGAALGSIFAERLLDAIVVFLFLLAPLLLGETKQSGLAALDGLQFVWMGAALLATSGAFFVAARWPKAIGQFAGTASEMIGLGRFKPRIVANIGELLSGLSALRYPRRCITAVFETFCMWSLIAATYWSGMLSFGITSPGVSGALFVTGVATLGIAIPSSPGYFGPFEAAIRFALGAYGIPPDTVVAYALTLHLSMVFTLLAVASVFALRLGLSWADVVSRHPRSPAPTKE